MFESTCHFSAPVASSIARRLTAEFEPVTKVTYRIPFEAAGVPEISPPAPKLFCHRIVPVPRSSALITPAGEVTKTTCPSMIEPVHWIGNPPPTDVVHCGVSGPWKGSGFTPPRSRSWWNCGHSVLGGAASSITTDEVAVWFGSTADDATTSVRSTMSSGASAGTWIETTTDRVVSPGNCPVSTRPSPSVSVSRVTPSAW